MPLDDYSASDSLRIAARVLNPDDPNNPRNPEFLARAAAASKHVAQPAAPPPTPAHPRPPAPAAPAPQAKSQPAAAAAPQQRPERHFNRRVPRTRAPQIPAKGASTERHQRACTICNHEDRDSIEQEFLNWIHPESIAHHYGVDWRAIYRHAHAKNLFPARQCNLRFALGRMVELASQVTPTMDGVLRTIRAFSSLDRNGRWTEIPTHVVVSSGAQLAQAKLSADSVKSLTLRSVLDAANPAEEVPENEEFPGSPTCHAEACREGGSLEERSRPRHDEARKA